jgi:hypothetical protein
MKEFKLNEKNYKMPTCWEDLTLEHYVNLSVLEENKTEYLLGELYLLKIIEVLCSAEGGELDELTIEMVTELSKEVGFLQEQPKWGNTKNIKINDMDYAFPAELNKLTMGEMISIKTLQEQATSQAAAIPLILAIILRPAKLVKDNESGKESWIQDKFDANNIEFRRDLFLKQPVFELMGPVTFFLSGSGISTPNIKDSMEKEVK